MATTASISASGLNANGKREAELEEELLLYEERSDNEDEQQPRGGKKMPFKKVLSPKKRKLAAKLACFLDMPQDVFIEICSHLDLQTIFSLYSANRQFCAVLVHPSLRYLWEDARERSKIPALTAPGFDIFDYADLLFGTFCTATGCQNKPNKREKRLDFLFRVRLCAACSSTRIVRDLNRMVYRWNQDLYLKTNVVGPKKSWNVYLQANMDTVDEIIKDKWAGKPPGDQELVIDAIRKRNRAREVDKRKIVAWVEQDIRDRENAILKIGTDRKAAIEKRFMDLGWPSEYFQDPAWLGDKNLTIPTPLNDFIFTRLRKALTEILEDIKKRKTEEARRALQAKLQARILITYPTDPTSISSFWKQLAPLPTIHEFINYKSVTDLWVVKDSSDVPPWLNNHSVNPLEERFDAIMEELTQSRENLVSAVDRALKEKMAAVGFTDTRLLDQETESGSDSERETLSGNNRKASDGEGGEVSDIVGDEGPARTVGASPPCSSAAGAAIAEQAFLDSDFVSPPMHFLFCGKCNKELHSREITTHFCASTWIGGQMTPWPSFSTDTYRIKVERLRALYQLLESLRTNGIKPAEIKELVNPFSCSSWTTVGLTLSQMVEHVSSVHPHEKSPRMMMHQSKDAIGDLKMEAYLRIKTTRSSWY